MNKWGAVGPLFLADGKVSEFPTLPPQRKHTVLHVKCRGTESFSWQSELFSEVEEDIKQYFGEKYLPDTGLSVKFFLHTKPMENGLYKHFIADKSATRKKKPRVTSWSEYIRTLNSRSEFTNIHWFGIPYSGFKLSVGKSTCFFGLCLTSQWLVGKFAATRSKPKTNRHLLARKFPSTWQRLHEIVSNSYWLVALFMSLAIGQSNCSGFGFRTLNSKLL